MFDATNWIMGIAAVALVALVGAVWRSVKETLKDHTTRQEETAKQVTNGLAEFRRSIDRLEFTVFGVQGQGGHAMSILDHERRIQRLERARSRRATDRPDESDDHTGGPR